MFMYMRGIMVLSVVMLMALVAVGQPAGTGKAEVVLPWLPVRDTHHIHLLHSRIENTTTGELTMKTEAYDRSGYLVDSLTRNVYDEHGRLREQVRIGWDETRMRQDTSLLWHVDYDADGTVRRIRNVYDGGRGEFVYDLIAHRVHSQFGLLEYAFRRENQYGDMRYLDTVYLRRSYDSTGHLLHEECKGGLYSMDVFDIRYSYDTAGRMVSRVGLYYESSDSLHYHYDAQGVLTGVTGKDYDLGMEAEVTITCWPDGIPRERIARWNTYEEGDDDESVDYTRYDRRGVVVYFRSGNFIFTYDIDYWN